MNKIEKCILFFWWDQFESDFFLNQSIIYQTLKNMKLLTLKTLMNLKFLIYFVILSEHLVNVYKKLYKDVLISNWKIIKNHNRHEYDAEVLSICYSTYA